VSCWTRFVGPEQEPLFVKKGSGAGEKPLYILSDRKEWGVLDGPAHHGSVMFRKSAYLAVGGYRKEFYYGQDWDLWYRLGEVGCFQMCRKKLYQAQVTADSISSVSQKEQEKIARLSREAMRARHLGKDDREFLEKIGMICKTKRKSSSWRKAAGYYFIGECLRKNNNVKSMHYFLLSLRSNPFLGKAWIRLLQTRRGIFHG